MQRHIRRVIVVGAGSAGFMSALAMKLTLPGMEVVVIRSPKVPVIGVGESTTVAVPRFLHEMLGLDRKQFFAEVRPSWKLGIRYEWGPPGDSHFNYTFDPCVDLQTHPAARINAFCCQRDMRDSSLFYALMDRAKAPCMVTAAGQPRLAANVGYHIENQAYIGYLERKAQQFGVGIVEQDVVEVHRDPEGFVTHLQCENGALVAGDLFVDCTGFSGLLIAKTMGVPFLSFSDSLFVDTAVVGSWKRTDEVIRPYTTATTMDHGWAWQIEFEEHITRGYVHASAFCTPEQAMAELRAKNPRIGELRTIRFRSGRHDRFWIKNVVAVGNSAGFVEPLEATALHMVVEHLRWIRQVLHDAQGQLIPEMIDVQNERFRVLWDDIRDFLAIHYKFNRRLSTPFWDHCRTATALHGAERIAELYRVAGPTSVCDSIIPDKTIFGLNGYLSLLVGQQAPTLSLPPAQAEWQAYEQFRQRVRQEVQHALGVKEALQMIHSPAWQWPQPGR